MKGALFVAGYEASNYDDEQLRGARDLLKPTIPCVIVHTTLDEFSTPLSHKIYWGTLLNARLGAGYYDKSDQLVMVTKTKYSHNGLRGAARRPQHGLRASG